MIKIIHYGVRAKVRYDANYDLWTINNRKLNIVGEGRTMKQAKIMFQSKITDILMNNLNK